MWPDDKVPRFIVTTVTGHGIGSSHGGSSGGKQPVAAQVVDRAYAHQIVREYLSYKCRAVGAVATAQKHADALNAKDAADE